MKTLTERLAAAMEECGKKPADLVRETGAKSSSVHNWLNGKTKNLKGNNLVILARYLNVSEAWLADGVGPKERRRTGWPFTLLDEAKVKGLPEIDLIRLETAILLTARDILRIDIAVPGSEKKEAM